MITKTKNRRSNPAKAGTKPRIPATLVDLADFVSIDLEGGETVKCRRTDNFALCGTQSGTEIWIVSRSGGRKVLAHDERGENLYETFTGFEHDPTARLIKTSPKSLQKIGRAMNIIYRSDKFSKPGNSSPYIHTFSKYPTVSVDNKTNPQIIVLRGGAIRIKPEGITG